MKEKLFIRKKMFIGVVVISTILLIFGVVGAFSFSGGIKANLSEKYALKRAEAYLNSMAFSYEGLKEQLKFEKFTTEQAIYAVDNCGANWFEQASRKAKTYLDSAAFSYEGLKEQLEYEKFLTEQAVYGVDNCGANWFEQASKKAKTYLDSMPFFYDSLIEQLIFEKFTREQAVFGVNSQGLWG